MWESIWGQDLMEGNRLALSMKRGLPDTSLGGKSSMKKERGGETRKIFCSSSNCLAPNEEIRN